MPNRRLVAAATILLLAGCRQAAEEPAANNVAANAAKPAAATAEAAFPGPAPASREAALKLMHDRHENMEDIGDSTKLISRELKKDQPDLAAIQASAATIARLAPGVPSWFPTGTGPETGKTHAKPAIWEKPRDFAQKAGDFRASAAAFDAAAKSGDLAAIRGSFADLGKTCKACHDTYRSKDD